ncbi:phosphoribosyltransferase family protein [Burkholderia ubonensis]|uniref:phosphoribosyltransferase family protein n=1 Tax=Burkholderia ubonensis TaxID=101571 RepID=UPI0009B38F80
MYLNGVEPGDRVVIVDDLISTGGTLIGLVEAVRRAGAHVEQIVCVAEKADYAGVERVRDATGLDVTTLVRVSVAGDMSRVLDVNY